LKGSGEVLEALAIRVLGSYPSQIQCRGEKGTVKIPSPRAGWYQEIGTYSTRNPNEKYLFFRHGVDSLGTVIGTLIDHKTLIFIR
jgi:hypothetical protein